MMKLALALVALFCLCYSTPVPTTQHDPNLNDEMIKAMTELDGRVSFRSGFTLSFPGRPMFKNASNCVIQFISALKNVLQNVTDVPDRSKHHFEELKANLKQLESRQGKTPNANAMCTLQEKHNNSLPFRQYIIFMKKLNSSSKK